MILIGFILLNIITILFFNKKNFNLFIISFFALLFIEPIFQKLTDPTLYGATYNVFGFDRFKTNLILILTFIILLLSSNPVKDYREINKKFKIFVFIVIAFHVFNIFFSIHITTSLIITLTSVLGPILFLKVLLRIPSNYFNNLQDVVRNIYIISIIFLFIGLFMYVFNASASSLHEYERSGGGLWMSNISTQILAPFFPIIFSSIKFKNKTLLRFLVVPLFIFLLIVSMSRTALLVYFFMTFLVLYNKRGKLKFILYASFFLIVIIQLLNDFFNINIVEMYTQRFLMKGDLTESISGDTRFTLFSQTVDLLIENPLFGSGIATFQRLNSFGFSNIHNIYLNILVERGIIGLILLISFIKYFIKINRKIQIKVIDDKRNEFYKLILIGFIGFFMIGLTGNDLFISSGFITGWPLYILLFLLTIQIAGNNHTLKQMETEFKKPF